MFLFLKQLDNQRDVRKSQNTFAEVATNHINRQRSSEMERSEQLVLSTARALQEETSRVFKYRAETSSLQAVGEKVGG